MLVVMTCTMVVAAPMTVVFGCSWRCAGPGLSWLLAVSLPVLVVILGIIVSRMVPQFRLMQERLDEMNNVLRGQIVGCEWCGRLCANPWRRSASTRQ